MDNETDQAVFYTITCMQDTTNFRIDSYYRSSLQVNIPINFIISANIVFLNVLVIYALMKKKDLRTPANYLLVNTAVSDFIVGLIGLPAFTIVVIQAVSQVNKQCWLYITAVILLHIFCLQSFFGVILTLIDISLALFTPYFYSSKITSNVNIYVWVCVTILFIVAVGVTSFVLAKKSNILYVIEGITFPSLLAIFTCAYAKVFITVRKVNRAIHSQYGKFRKKKNIRTKKKEARMATLALLMFLSLCICYLPYITLVLIWARKLQINKDRLDALHVWTITFVALKSIVNPLLYCFTMSKIRHAVKELLMKKREGKQTDISKYYI